MDEWGIAPYEGGFMKWPAGLMDRLTIIKKYWYALSSYKAAAPKSAKWANSNPAQGNLVIELIHERIKWQKHTKL